MLMSFVKDFRGKVRAPLSCDRSCSAVAVQFVYLSAEINLEALLRYHSKIPIPLPLSSNGNELIHKAFMNVFSFITANP